MAGIATRDSEQIEKANGTGLTPVVFIHGLWLLSSSWDRWAGVFEEAGYTALAPAWPDDPETVDEANAEPQVFARKTVGRVADHYGEVIGKLERKPDRGPLLIISGEKDHTVPWAIANSSYKKQSHNVGITEIVEIPDRGHALTIDSGWRKVADTALDFVKRFV